MLCVVIDWSKMTRLDTFYCNTLVNDELLLRGLWHKKQTNKSERERESKERAKLPVKLGAGRGKEKFRFCFFCQLLVG